MHPKFAAVAEALDGSFENLMAQVPRHPDQMWPTEKVRGVYLFSEAVSISMSAERTT